MTFHCFTFDDRTYAGFIINILGISSCTWGKPRQSWILDYTPWIPDSRSWIMNSYQWNLDSRFQSVAGFWNPWAECLAWEVLFSFIWAQSSKMRNKVQSIFWVPDFRNTPTINLLWNPLFIQWCPHSAFFSSPTYFKTDRFWIGWIPLAIV